MPAAARLPLDDEPASYTFDLLDDSAKEQAREWFLRDYPDDGWWDFVYEDADAIATMLGISIDRQSVRYTDGSASQRIAINFSGFCSQGDGACFEGVWTPVGDPLASLGQVMEHAPLDSRLHDIALDILVLAERCNALIPDAHVRVTNSYRGSHSGCTSFDIDLPTPEHIDNDNGLQVMVFNALLDRAGLDFGTFETSIKAALRAFMDWIYEQLSEEYEHLCSEENVDGAILANEYTFDEDGRRA